MTAPAIYPKPSAIGGTLIRTVITEFKKRKFALPIREPILIAVSGGVDSMVLAHLVSRYGRKIIDPNLITLLHFDHQWRKASATTEKKAVEKLAKNLGVKFKSVKLAPPSKSQKSKKNREADARQKRCQYFDENAGEGLFFRYVFTAHHQNDLAETLFWRFLRGEIDVHREGIKFKDHQTIRPFLKVEKASLYTYAKSEKIRFYEDPTNRDHDQMRAFLRTKIFPLLKKQIPNFEKSISGYAEHGFGLPQEGFALADSIEVLTETRLNRHQRSELQKMLMLQERTGIQPKSLSLAKNWVLERQNEGFFIRKIVKEPS